MPKPRMVLCRGWQGLGASAIHTVKKWSERDVLALGRSLVLVPSAAASHLFRRQLEEALSANREVVFLPVIATSAELLEDLCARTSGRIRLADPILREAILERGFQVAVENGSPAPFPVRGGLAARVLQFYDQLAANRATLDDFTARALEELDAPDDEGAEKLAAQTRFLRASLESYRQDLDRLGLSDPPSARAALVGEPFPYERILVLGSETLTAIDLDFLSTLESVDELVLAVPEGSSDVPSALAKVVSDVRVAKEGVDDRPQLLTSPVLVARDREESLVDAVRMIKHLARPLERVAIVVPSPLPYLYLAKKVLGEAGIPYVLQDSFPLAAEPYVAAVDLAIELVATDAERSAALAILRSPFFEFEGVGPTEVAAFDELTLRYREPGGVRRWKNLFERKSRPDAQPALPGMESSTDSKRALAPLAAILRATEALAPLAAEGPITAKIACLEDFLETYAHSLSDERHERARAAVFAILRKLEDAARQVGDPPIGFATFREKLRRAVEAHTFALRTGEQGVNVVDARSAGYGSFDLVILLGLNEAEWPARGERNIFFPQWLLRDFGWLSDRELLSHERTRFRLLLDLSREHLVLVRHQLEDEIPTVASPFLEEVEGWIEEDQASTETIDDAIRELIVTKSEALRRGLIEPELRLMGERRPGAVGGPIAVADPVSPTSLELYLRCPFKYFSRYLLGLEEEEEVDEMLTPLERGRILHELLHEGFEEWDRGRETPRPIEPETYEEALGVFRGVAMRKLPYEHRSVELARLFGSPGEPGAMEWLLRRELSRGPLRRRLVEHAFQSPLRLERGPSGESPWFVQIKGRVDRADVDADGFLHVFDYKSGRAPEAAVTLQVPLYAMCLSQELGAPVRESAYLSFRDRHSTTRAEYETTSALLVETYRRIHEGRFPPRPYKEPLCRSCGFVGVCRKEITESLDA